VTLNGSVAVIKLYFKQNGENRVIFTEAIHVDAYTVSVKNVGHAVGTTWLMGDDAHYLCSSYASFSHRCVSEQVGCCIGLTDFRKIM